MCNNFGVLVLCGVCGVLLLGWVCGGYGVLCVCVVSYLLFCVGFIIVRGGFCGFVLMVFI